MSEPICTKCHHNDGVNAEGLCNHRYAELGEALPNLCPCQCVFPESVPQVDLKCPWCQQLPQVGEGDERDLLLCATDGCVMEGVWIGRRKWNTRTTDGVTAALNELREMFPDQSVSIKRQEFYGTGMFHSSGSPFSVSVHVDDIGFSDEETVAAIMQKVREYHRREKNGRSNH